MEFSSYITGFTDGEGTFQVSFNRRDQFRTHVEVRPGFSISQHKRNRAILERIQHYFGCGGIRFSARDQNYKYEVRSLSDLKRVIIPHFKQFPLQTSKQKDFQLFEEIVEDVSRNHHLNAAFLRIIIEKAYRMNPAGKRRYTQAELLKLMAR